MQAFSLPFSLPSLFPLLLLPSVLQTKIMLPTALPGSQSILATPMTTLFTG